MQTSQSVLFMTSPDTPSPASRSIWDRATRLWHWTIVLAIAAMWFTAEFHYFAIHRIIGILLVAALVFRLYWGLFGSRTARFTSFVRGPKAIGAYIVSLRQKGRAQSVGHSALGALGVVALLLAMAAQLGTGLFAVDTDGMNSGPLARFVSFPIGRTVADLHELSFNILLALIVLHVAAVALYLLGKRINLVRPMITGRGPAVGPDNKKPGPFALIIGVALSVAIAIVLFEL